MNIIELLKNQVTPKILQGSDQFQNEKIGALSAFYPILLTVLKSKPELITTLQNSLNPRLTDLFNHHPESVTKFLSLVTGDHVPQQEIENTLNHAIAPTLSLLGDQATSNDNIGIFDFIKSQWTNIQAALPAWATTFFTALGVNVGLIDNLKAHASTVVPPVQTATPVQPVTREPVYQEEQEKKSNWLLPIIALLILLGLIAFFFKQCSGNKDLQNSGVVGEPTSQVANTSLEAAELHLATDKDGKLTECKALIGDQSLLDQLKSKIGSIFGQTNNCQLNQDKAYEAKLVDQNALDTVLNKIKGLPNLTLAWVGNQLTLQGPDLAQVQKIADELKTSVPNLQVIASQSTPAVVDTDSSASSVDSGNNQATEALSKINGSDVSVSDIIAALNLQVINFATGSTNIPDANKAILDKAATLLKQIPNAKIHVKGFTDNVGNAAANKTLSTKRAQAVVDYLVSQGVDKKQLAANGFGQENPIADNSTKDGQFKNRRIEFAVSE